MINDVLKRTEKVIARFAVISDVHITHIGEGKYPFEQTLKLFSQLNPDGYVFAGDLAYMTEKSGGGICEKLYPKAYDIVNQLLDEYAKEVPRVIAIGNHEYPQCNSEPQISRWAKQLFENKFGVKINDHQIIKGYHFITIGGDSWDNNFSEETEKWAEREIDEAISEDVHKPVFVVFHKPPYCTVVNSQKEPVLMSESFRAFLNSRQQIINITGDLHIPAQDPKTIWQDGFTVIQVPLNAVGQIMFDGCAKGTRMTEDKYSQGLIIDITHKAVRVYRVDTLLPKLLGEVWEIDVNDKENWKYTDRRFKENIIPYFEKDVMPEIKYEDGELTLRIRDAVCWKNNIESFPQYYDVKILDKQGKCVCRERVISEYYMTERSGYFEYSKRIVLNGDCIVEITPISSFYKSGQVVVAKITIHQE